MQYDFSNKKIGVAFTGSYCTYQKTFKALDDLSKTGADIITIFSENAQATSTRFGNSNDFISRAKAISGKAPILSIKDAEPIGPKSIIDLLVIMPCTGNTLAKLANGITDTPVLMASKAHLRNNKPILICLSSNDALGMNLKNIGILLNTKNIFFIPFGQDDYEKKPNSMVSKIDLLCPAIDAAFCGKQLQPVILSPS